MSNNYAFGRFEVRLDSRQLLGDGKAIDLGARAFDLLACLIEQRHRTVPKAELLDQVWPGLVVEENNLSVQVSTLRKLLGQDVIATIPSQGYRFSAALAEPAASSQVASEISGTAHEKPSIAVLSFRVLSDDSRARFLADGLQEDVIALLARVPGFLLISRGSTLVFNGSPAALSEIGAQLGVRYVVDGSVRLMADRVRVSTQLTEAQIGRVLWSGQFEGSYQEIEDLQDRITRGIITELEPELMRAEISLIRRQRPENLDAWAHYHQALGTMGLKGWREDAIQEALSELQQAVSADPDFGLAHAYAAMLTALGVDTGLILASPDVEQRVLDSAARAVTLDEGSSTVLGYAGCALSDLGHLDRGFDLIRHALEIDPSNASAHVALGATLVRSGQIEAGIEKMRYGMQLTNMTDLEGYIEPA